MGLGPQHYAATVPAVPAVRTTQRHEGFSAEAGGSATAVTGLGKDTDVIDKHRRMGARREGFG